LAKSCKGGGAFAINAQHTGRAIRSEIVNCFTGVWRHEAGVVNTAVVRRFGVEGALARRAGSRWAQLLLLLLEHVVEHDLVHRIQHNRVESVHLHFLWI